MKAFRHFVVIALAVALETYGQSFSTDPADYEKILLPVVLGDLRQPIQGGGGAIWSTRIIARNDANVDVALFGGNPFNCAFGCLPSDPPPMAPAHSSFVPYVSNVDDDENHWFTFGEIYYVDRVHADDVFFAVRLIESSSAPVETEMPVVREREFRHDKVVLLDVSLRAQSSEILRIYDPNHHPGVGMRVRIFSSENLLLAERPVTPFYYTHWTPPDFETRPGYSEIELLEFFPDLQEPQRVRIEIEAAGIEFWAFVSVTDRTTHHVSLYTPQ